MWTEEQRSGPFITWTLSAGKRFTLGRKSRVKKQLTGFYSFSGGVSLGGGWGLRGKPHRERAGKDRRDQGVIIKAQSDSVMPVINSVVSTYLPPLLSFGMLQVTNVGLHVKNIYYPWYSDEGKHADKLDWESQAKNCMSLWHDYCSGNRRKLPRTSCKSQREIHCSLKFRLLEPTVVALVLLIPVDSTSWFPFVWLQFKRLYPYTSI